MSGQQHGCNLHFAAGGVADLFQARPSFAFRSCRTRDMAWAISINADTTLFGSQVCQTYHARNSVGRHEHALHPLSACPLRQACVNMTNAWDLCHPRAYWPKPAVAKRHTSATKHT
eukprot:2977394-Amphidinium_carterae.1